MKRYLLAVAVAGLFTLPALAQTTPSAPSGRKDCEELKKEIAAKIESNGVKNYELTIVKTEDVKDAQVVGSCDGGTKKITYTRK